MPDTIWTPEQVRQARKYLERVPLVDASAVGAGQGEAMTTEHKPLTEAEVREMLARAEAATPMERTPSGNYGYCAGLVIYVQCIRGDMPPHEADLAFDLAARTDVPRLAEEVLRLREAIVHAYEYIDEHRHGKAKEILFAALGSRAGRETQ